MKNLMIVLVTLTMSNFLFAQNGYVCLPSTDKDESKLLLAKSKLGDDFLDSIGVVVVRPETCAEIIATMNLDVCKVGKLRINIDVDKNAKIYLSKKNAIALTCEYNFDIGPFPAIGGSN